MLSWKHGNASYAGFASFTFGDVSPRAREELTQRRFKIDDRQLPGPPIGFARLGGIRLYCATRFRISHLNCQRVQVGAEDFGLEETALRSGTLTRNGLLNLSSGRHPGHPRSPRSVSVTDSYHNICCVRERAAWCTNSRKLL